MIPTLFNPALYGSAGGDIAGWKELGRTTLGSAADTITVSSLEDKRYYMILTDALDNGSAINCAFRYNNDSGNNYSNRHSLNSGADSTGTSQNALLNHYWVENASNRFGIDYISNISSNEKLTISHTVYESAAGAGNAPQRSEQTSKWTNTSNAINRVDALNSGAGDFNTGSEVVVLGWDPSDNHTSNFWTELASADLSGGAADALNSGTFSSKKYLWIQWYCEISGAAISAGTFRFNSDTGSNYARRQSSNGAADSTYTSQSNIDVNITTVGNYFMNMFVINNASNEKLVIGHAVDTTSTFDATGAPQRMEFVGKWVNTSDQIDEVNVVNVSAGDFGTSSTIKVWGAD